MTIDIITATHDTFMPYVGDTFTVEQNGAKVSLILDNVKIFENSTIRDNHVEIDGVVYPPRQAFALTFEGPREPVLPSDTLTLMHADIGALSLFVSAFRQDHDCMLYESVFN